MRNPMLLSVVSISTLLGTAQLVVAQDLVDARDTATIAEIARGYGSVDMGIDSVGDPMLTGRIDGNLYTVSFYGCDNGADCTNIQFRAAWVNSGRVTMQDMNVWNQENRFGKAYLDTDGDPVIEWDVNLFGGVSRRNLDDSFDWWKLVMAEFSAQVQ